jgi:hypothetical protein
LAESRKKEIQERNELNATIGKHGTLGQQADYRVNIPRAASAKVAHSYFLKVDGDGNIIESTPISKGQVGEAP